jgi:hypothetical protein
MESSALVIHLVPEGDAGTTLCGQPVREDTRWRPTNAVPVEEMNQVCLACFDRLTAAAGERRGRRLSRRR